MGDGAKVSRTIEVMKTVQKAYIVATLILVSFGLLRLDYGWTEPPVDDLLRAGTLPNGPLPPWKPGLLDIHHLHVGSAVSSLIITPDGTTILVDAGEIDIQHQMNWWKELGPPYDQLQAVPPFPNASKGPSEWILDYLRHFLPREHLELDYVLVTHFHGDHFGDDTDRMPRAVAGNYSLSGIPAIAQGIPIAKLIDRGYPNYDFPKVLSQVGDRNMVNYLHFVNATASAIKFEQFQVGSTHQVRQLYDSDSNNSDFHITVLKSSANVLSANGSITSIPGSVLDDKGQWNENTMSAAFVINYGDFRYYEGGDQEVVRDQDGTVVFDTIGPTAEAAGKVDVASLNHHGHGVTKEFVKHADPNVLILQGWCSDQPASTSVELLSGKTVQIFATFIFPQRLKALGPSLSKLFASTEGHVVVRVQPRPPVHEFLKQQSFDVFVLNGDRQVKAYHGPYTVGRKST